MRQSRLGKPHSDEAHERMSQAHKARGTLLPGIELWTPEEDEAIRTLPPSEQTKEHPGLLRTRGHGSRVAFRTLIIKPL